MIRRHATGGSIPSLLPRLSDAELQVTQSQNNTGNVRHLSFILPLPGSWFWLHISGESFSYIPSLSYRQMFEKFSYSDVDSAGRGGEYTVQAGFGWTNGVVLWAASNYGKVLNAPDCPPLILATSSTNSSSGTGTGNGTSSGSGSGSGNSSGSAHTKPVSHIVAFTLLVGAVVVALV